MDTPPRIPSTGGRYPCCIRGQSDRPAVPTTPVGVSQHGCWDHCPPTCNRSCVFRPSRLQIGAELTRQGRPRPPQFSVALQLWLVATTASPRALTTRPMMTTGACSTTGPSPFRLLPIGGQKAIPPPTVSAPNRSKRDNCCSVRTLPNRAAIPSRQGLKTGVEIVYSKTIYYNRRLKE